MEEKTPYSRMPLWRLVDLATREMTETGREYFSRQDICDYINGVLLAGENQRKAPDSINPVIQGVTVNAPGGAPGAINRRILYRMDRGLYRRCRDHETALPRSSEPAHVSGISISRRDHHLTESRRRLLDDVLRSLEQEELFTARLNEEGALLLPEGVMRGMDLRPGDLLVFEPGDGGKFTVKKGRLRLEISG
jgi:hypothetical protein